MKLTPDYNKSAFVETINRWDQYDTCVTIQAGQIPESATMEIELRGGNGDGYYDIHVYRLHPFSLELIDARLDMVRLSQKVSDSNPTVKFAIMDWTPEKLAETQAKVAYRTKLSNEHRKQHKAAVLKYNTLLEAQEREIKGETP